MRPKKNLSLRHQGPTHPELVARASTWLKARGYKLVITEAVTHTQEVPDALGWKNGKWSALIECKVSRQDFRQDLLKPSRKNPDKRLGQLRYYFAPQGIIPLEEVPDDWGLLELQGKTVKLVKQAPKKSYSTQVAANELLVLTHLLRRAEIRGLKLNQTWAEFQASLRRGTHIKDVHLDPE